jgi:hypothetical protein
MEQVMLSPIEREEKAFVIYLRLLAETAQGALEREQFYRQLPSQPIERRRQALASERKSGV